MSEIVFGDFQSDLHKYLSDYTLRMFGISLSPTNLQRIFRFKGRTERHIFPLFFYCYLGDEYLNFYLTTGRRDYLFTSLHILGVMSEGVLYNGILMRDIIKQIEIRYAPVAPTGKRIILSDDVHDLVHRSQKFFWTFLCKYYPDAQ